MAGDQKISALTNGNPAQSGDLLPIDRSGANFAVTAGSVAALAQGGVSQRTARVPRSLKVQPNSSAMSGGGVTFGSQPTGGGVGQSPGSPFLVANNDTPAPDTIYVGIQTTTANPSSSAYSLMDNIDYFVPPARGNVYTTANLAVVKWRVRVIDTVDVRLWLTMSDIYGTLRNDMNAALPSTINLFGFRYDTSAGDSHWMAVTSLTSSANTVVDTGITPVINESATFAIEVSPTTLKFYINDNLVATITTNILASTIYIGDLFRVDNIGIANVKGFAINEVTLFENY